MLRLNRRITSASDWKRLHIKGRLVRSPIIVLKVVRTKRQYTRFGFSISTKVSKHAIIRNRIKRQLRAIINELLDSIIEGYDIGVLVRPAIVGKQYKNIAKTLTSLLQQAKVVRK